MSKICHCFLITILHESFAGPDKRLSNEIRISKTIQEIESAMQLQNEYTTPTTHTNPIIAEVEEKIYTILW